LVLPTSECFATSRLQEAKGIQLVDALNALRFRVARSRSKSQFATVPCDAEELVEVVNATDEEARLLSTEPGSALLSITRTTFDAAGAPFEFRVTSPTKIG